MEHADFMRRAVEISRSSAERPGTRPYAAVVVRNGEIVGEGLNHAEAKCDPTAHGEIEAIRDACRNLKTTDLSDCEIYASCEPCVICMATMYRAGIRKLYYGVSLDEDTAIAARESDVRGLAVPKRIPNAEVIRQVAMPVKERSLKGEQVMHDEAQAALDYWWSKQGGAYPDEKVE